MLSIITVNWNGVEYLERLVNSIEKYTKDYELIIVDNNSTDGSIEYLETIDRKHNVVYLHDNTGWVGGINEGLIQAEGEYICLINNDIEVSKNWYTDMKKHFTEDVGMVGCTTDFTMGLQKADLKGYPKHHRVHSLIGWLMLTKRSVLEKVATYETLEPINGMAGLDPLFGLGSCDDLDLAIRIENAGYELIIARDVFVKHLGSKSYEKMFGKDLKKTGTIDNIKYMSDVYEKMELLKNKWGEDRVNICLKSE